MARLEEFLDAMRSLPVAAPVPGGEWVTELMDAHGWAHIEATARELLGNGEPGSSVYFMQVGQRGPVKIGKAENVRKRFKQIAPNVPADLHVLGEIPGGLEREAQIHAMFAGYRLQNEWFAPADSLLLFVGFATELFRDGPVDPNRIYAMADDHAGGP